MLLAIFHVETGHRALQSAAAASSSLGRSQDFDKLSATHVCQRAVAVHNRLNNTSRSTTRSKRPQDRRSQLRDLVGHIRGTPRVLFRRNGRHMFFESAKNNFHTLAGYHLPGCHAQALAQAWTALGCNDKLFFSAQAKLHNRDAQRQARNRRFAARTPHHHAASSFGGFGCANYPISRPKLEEFSKTHPRSSAHDSFRDTGGGIRVGVDDANIQSLLESTYMQTIASRWVSQCSL